MGGNRLPATLRATGLEIKALDIPQTTYTINSTASITAMNLIRTGSTFCNRIGRRVEMKNIRVSGIIQNLRTVAGEDYCRILIVYDRQTNGALPAIADIIQSTDQAAANTTNVFSGLNLNNRDRFKIIRDMRIFLPAATVTAGTISNQAQPDPVSPTYKIEMFSKLGGLLAQYKADSAPAVIGDIATGGLYLVVLGATAAASEGYQAALEVRLRFNDH